MLSALRKMIQKENKKREVVESEEEKRINQVFSIDVAGLIIISFFSRISDVISLSLVNRSLNILTENNMTWEIMHEKYFPGKFSRQENSFVKSLFFKQISLHHTFTQHQKRLALLIHEDKPVPGSQIDKALALCEWTELNDLKVIEGLLELAFKKNNQPFLDTFFKRFTELKPPATRGIRGIYLGLSNHSYNKSNLAHLAVRCRQIEWILSFKDKERKIFQQYDEKGYTPLHLAVYLGDASVVKALLQIVSSNQNQLDEHGWTALHIAASQGHTHLISIILGAETSFINIYSKEAVAEGVDYSPLHLTAYFNHYETADELCIRGATVDRETSREYTSLHVAAYFGHIETMKVLLSHGAKVNARCKNLMPKFAIYKNDDNEISFTAREMLDFHKANLNLPLYWAMVGNQRDAAKLLLEHYSAFSVFPRKSHLNSAERLVFCAGYFEKSLPMFWGKDNATLFKQESRTVLYKHFNKAYSLDPEYFKELMIEAKAGIKRFTRLANHLTAFRSFAEEFEKSLELKEEPKQKLAS